MVLVVIEGRDFSLFMSLTTIVFAVMDFDVSYQDRSLIQFHYALMK